MSLSDLAALGSFASGMAVIVTLAFLVLQMRQTNHNQRSLIQQGRTTRLADLALKRTEPLLAEGFSRLALDAKEATLTASQFEAIRVWMITFFWNYEDSFLQFRTGNLDQESWEIDLATLKTFLTHPAFRVQWRTVRSASSGAFRDFIDKLVAETPVVPLRRESLSEWMASLNEEEGLKPM